MFGMLARRSVAVSVITEALPLIQTCVFLGQANMRVLNGSVTRHLIVLIMAKTV